MSISANPEETAGSSLADAASKIRLQFVLSPHLPPLAWLASIKPPYTECIVEHGRTVETREDFFVEGLWPGPFADGNFDCCETFFGSGAVRRAHNTLVFVPSSATVDRLYYSDDASEFVCSNSLPFLLAAREDELIPTYSNYGRDNHESIKKGIEAYVEAIPTRGGRVKRLMYHNLIVERGVGRKQAKPLPPQFRSYEEYRDFLETTISKLVQNARSNVRATQLRLVSTQSSGYDTSAINAMVSKYGPDIVLSISEAKERNLIFKPKPLTPGRTDSGVEIARLLGVNFSPIDRRFFLKDEESEFLYWAEWHHCQDINLHQVKEHVGNGAVLFTGILGELWYNAKSLRARLPKRRRSIVNDRLEAWDAGGHGLSEARLHIGYVHAPLPYLGARSRPGIFEISNSEAMRPWSIGGTYDRPIARRIAEEAGVPRHLFGHTKLGTVVLTQIPHLPHGATLRREFLRYLRRERGTIFPVWMLLTQKINSILWKVKQTVGRPARIPNWIKGNRLGKKIIERAARLPVLGRQFNTMIYVYCVNKAALLYRKARP